MYLPLLRILYLTYVYTSLTPYSKTNVEKFCHDREITLKLSCNHVIKFMDDKIKPVTILNLVNPNELPTMKYIGTAYFGRCFKNFLYFLSIS